MNSYPTTPQAPEFTQPGGGLGMRIEMGRAKVRRALLRLFRPGYVRRMKEIRQGACDRYADQVIDYRDLKYIRPVCGFSFPNQPHPCRPFLGFARYGLCEVLVFTLIFLMLGGGLALLACLVHWGFWIPFGLIIPPYAEILYFFRDPERTIRQDPDVLLSPADGVITHVEETEEIEFPGKVLRISMFLSIFNVHVNRMPGAARITNVRYFPGAFLDARDTQSPVRNEQLWIDAKDPAGNPLRVKQISGKIARRIVCWLKPGDQVARGERIGMIKLGSRADLILPLEKVQEVRIKVGDVVRGGTTILLSLCR
jgi:phosphatidylserine decarboxylase